MHDLMQIYRRLYSYYGPRDWWPAETPFEVVVGAILTQNTNWRNVEKAIVNLRRAGALTPETLRNFERAQLEKLIRPSGFFRQKTERLSLFCRHLSDNYRDDLQAWLQDDLQRVRSELLSLKGIGPETADSILLYAGRRPTFVVDAYTGRLFERLGVLDGTESYAEIRDRFMAGTERNVQLYNEYHALIVIHCKSHCLKNPKCRDCPLADICVFAARNTGS